MKMRDRKRRFLARFSLDPEFAGCYQIQLFPKPYSSKRVRIGKKYQ